MIPPEPAAEKPQNPTQPVTVAAMGAISAVGADTAQTAASVRAGLSAYQESDYCNREGSSMIMALVPDDALPPLDQELLKETRLTGRQQRILRLHGAALQPMIEQLGDQPVPLMLAAPEKQFGRRTVVSDTFLTPLAVQTKLNIDFNNSYVYPYGRAAGFFALEAAMLLLEQNICTQVLVAGADTYLDMQLLAMLDREERVLAQETMDGFAPGEGAAAILLKKSDGNGVKIYPPGIAQEPGHRYSEQPYKGEGLSNAISQALVYGNAPVKTVMAGLTGEHFGAKEWGVSVVRNRKQLDEDFNIMHPVDCFGDCGAALGLMLMQLAITGLRGGYLPGPVLAWSSSEHDPRAAVYIER